MVRTKKYHLLISYGGTSLICIIESERDFNFTEAQKEELTNLYGNYIVVLIPQVSLDCFSELNIVTDINNYLNLHEVPDGKN